jgi:hypothetical protein
MVSADPSQEITLSLENSYHRSDFKHNGLVISNSYFFDLTFNLIKPRLSKSLNDINNNSNSYLGISITIELGGRRLTFLSLISEDSHITLLMKTVKS